MVAKVDVGHDFAGTEDHRVRATTPDAVDRADMCLVVGRIRRHKLADVTSVHDVGIGQIVGMAQAQRVPNFLCRNGEIVEGARGVAVADRLVPGLSKVLPHNPTGDGVVRIVSVGSSAEAQETPGTAGEAGAKRRQVAGPDVDDVGR